jgi:DNA (cytosine-5)-methyltransferase 1
MKDDYRNYLFESFVTAVRSLKPKMFVFENVPGMLSAKPGGMPVTERIYKAFSDIEYEITSPDKLKNLVLDASLFGVPQKRKRVILIGVRRNSNYDLDTIYSEISKYSNKKSIPTVKDAIGKLPPLIPLEIPIKQKGKNISHSLLGKKIMHHEPRYHNQRDIGIFIDWIRNEMNSKSTIEKISFYNKLLNKRSNHTKYRNLEWDKPSPTVVAHLYKDGLMFIHPDAQQARSISVREAATLQSFPNDYIFYGCLADQFKMIGNAVPVKLGKAIGTGIADYLLKQKN